MNTWQRRLQRCDRAATVIAIVSCGMVSAALWRIAEQEPGLVLADIRSWSVILVGLFVLAVSPRLRLAAWGPVWGILPVLLCGVVFAELGEVTTSDPGLVAKYPWSWMVIVFGMVVRIAAALVLTVTGPAR